MAPNESPGQRQQRLEHTFQQDGFVVAKRVHVNECVGLPAEHQPSGDGSGVVESACGHVVAQRMEITSRMSWHARRAEAML